MRSRRFVAVTAALAALSLATTACDASPYAARVGSQVIKETALNVELHAWAGNTDYVSAFNSSNSSSGITVAGDAPGTWSTTWVANILVGIIDAAAVHQRLAATANLPDPAIIDAARAVSEISQIGWSRFSPSFRQTLVSRLADEAALTPATVPSSTLHGVYTHYQQYFLTQVCTLVTAVPTLDQAQSLAVSGLSNGPPICYDQSQLEGQPASFQSAVLSTPTGKVAAPIHTGYGYQVIQVTTRMSQDFTPEVQRVLSVAIVSAQGGANTILSQVLAAARVQVNPAYGTWRNSQVVPPAVPGSGT